MIVLIFITFIIQMIIFIDYYQCLYYIQNYPLKIQYHLIYQYFISKQKSKIVSFYKIFIIIRFFNDCQLFIHFHFHLHFAIIIIFLFHFIIIIAITLLLILAIGKNFEDVFEPDRNVIQFFLANWKDLRSMYQHRIHYLCFQFDSFLIQWIFSF